MAIFNSYVWHNQKDPEGNHMSWFIVVKNGWYIDKGKVS